MAATSIIGAGYADCIMHVNAHCITNPPILSRMSKEIHERLRVARERAGFKSASEAANWLGVEVPTYLAHENGSRGFRATAAEKYAKRFKVDLAWLLTGEEPRIAAPISRRGPAYDGASIVQVEGDTYARLPLYDIRAQAGKGALAYDGEPIGFRLFDFNWIKTASRSGIDQLKVIEVSGDSMEPTLYARDHVLVDIATVSLSQPGLFVLRIDDSLMVKRVQKLIGTGSIKVISDNPRYETEEIADEARISVVGRVIWIGRSVG